jgi:hypothetical protein
MKPSEIAGLGPAARAQIEAALEAGDYVVHAKPVQRTAHGRMRSRCAACGEIIVGETAADRHMKENDHHRYEVIL